MIPTVVKRNASVKIKRMTPMIMEHFFSDPLKQQPLAKVIAGTALSMPIKPLFIRCRVWGDWLCFMKSWLVWLKNVVFLNYYKSRVPLIIPALVHHGVCADCGLDSNFECMVGFVWPQWVFLIVFQIHGRYKHKPKKTKIKKKVGALLWDEKFTIYGHVLFSV